MKNYTFEEFNQDINILTRKIRDSFRPDAIVAIARGGMTLGHFLAESLQNRHLYSLNSIHYEKTRKLDDILIFNIPDLSKANKVLIADDIIDSGETMIEIKRTLAKKFPNCEFKIVTLFYKQNALLQPDFSLRQANEWIRFFWDYELTQ